MSLSQEEVRKKTEEMFKNHRCAWLEMSHVPGCIDINKKYNTNMAGLTSVLISDIYTQSNITIENGDLFGMINDFLDKMSETLNLHPADCIILLSKILSDMMVQQVAVYELNQEGDK